MRKLLLAGIVFIAILSGCGQTQSSASTSNDGQKQSAEVSSTHEKQETPKQESSNNAFQPKEVEPKEIYDGVFDEPIDPITPANMVINRIGVDAAIEEVGEKKNGQMDVPKDDKNLGWFAPGTKPGEQGNAVMDGHVSDPTGKGVFWDLKKLERGDEVKVSDENGETLVFIVIEKQSFHFDEAPVDDIFGYTSRRALNLITCTGEYNHDTGNHSERLVVYTELKK